MKQKIDTKRDCIKSFKIKQQPNNNSIFNEGSKDKKQMSRNTSNLEIKTTNNSELTKYSLSTITQRF